MSEATTERAGTDADDTNDTNDTVPAEMTQESTLELSADADEKTSEESVSIRMMRPNSIFFHQNDD